VENRKGNRPKLLQPELPALYYLHNFLSLCETVQRQYLDILDAEERAFLQRFHGLSQAAQCLYVRLLSRRGPQFRLSKLAYVEIGALPAVVRELERAGAVSVAAGLEVENLGRLFTVVELAKAYGDVLPRGRAAGKVSLLQAIDELELTPEQHLRLLTREGEETFIAPTGVELVELLQLLFFGNRHQGMTDFVLRDLGVAQYYPYALDPKHRLFPCREALDEYLACCGAEDDFYTYLELDDDEGMAQVAALMLVTSIEFPVALLRWQRAWNRVAKELERRRQFDLATALFERSDRHPARERRARILAVQGDWSGVVALCESILSSPWCEAEQEAAEKLLSRARRKLGGPTQRRQTDSFQQMKLTLKPGGEGVELAAANFLAGDWHSVYFVENTLMNTLFGLAFWEQIFADIPGVFHHPYQGSPRDMYEGDFLANRQEAIAQRLLELRHGNLREELMGAYRRYCGYQCHWVDWRQVDEAMVDIALQQIPPQHLFAIWERQLFDPAENRSGFPDLIAFGNPAEGCPGKYCMIEVKGPGDSLQSNQKRWLRFFAENAIPAQVAWVEWAGA